MGVTQCGSLSTDLPFYVREAPIRHLNGALHVFAFEGKTTVV